MRNSGNSKRRVGWCGQGYVGGTGRGLSKQKKNECGQSGLTEDKDGHKMTALFLLHFLLRRFVGCQRSPSRFGLWPEKYDISFCGRLFSLSPFFLSLAHAMSCHVMHAIDDQSISDESITHGKSRRDRKYASSSYQTCHAKGTKVPRSNRKSVAICNHSHSCVVMMPYQRNL